MPRTLAELNTFGVHLLHEGEDYKLGVLLHDLDKADHISVASSPGKHRLAHLNRLDALLRIIERVADRDVLLYRRAIKDDPEDVKLAKLYSARESALKREEEEHRLLEQVFAQKRELYDEHPTLRRRLDGQRRATHAGVEAKAQLAQMTDKSERIIVRGNFYHKQAAELQRALKKESQRDKVVNAAASTAGSGLGTGSHHAEAENPACRAGIDSTHTDSSKDEEQQPSAGSTTHAASDASNIHNAAARHNRPATNYTPTAQVASQQGIYLARVFSKLHKKEQLLTELEQAKAAGAEPAKLDSLANAVIRASNIPPFHYSHQGSLAYIGSEKAIADLPVFQGNLAAAGFATYYFWRSAYISQLFSLRNRVLVGADWLKTKVLGRDVSRA